MSNTGATVLEVEAFCNETPKTIVQTHSHRWIIDEPESFGGSALGPSPVETMLAAVASSFVATGQWIATELGIRIRRMHVIVNGELNSDVFLGKVNNQRAGFSLIDIKIYVVSDAEESAFNYWHRQLLERCPVLDTLKVRPQIMMEIKNSDG